MRVRRLSWTWCLLHLIMSALPPLATALKPDSDQPEAFDNSDSTASSMHGSGLCALPFHHHASVREHNAQHLHGVILADPSNYLVSTQCARVPRAGTGIAASPCKCADPRSRETFRHVAQAPSSQQVSRRIR